MEARQAKASGFKSFCRARSESLYGRKVEKAQWSICHQIKTRLFSDFWSRVTVKHMWSHLSINGDVISRKVELLRRNYGYSKWRFVPVFSGHNLVESRQKLWSWIWRWRHLFNLGFSCRPSREAARNYAPRYERIGILPSPSERHAYLSQGSILVF